MLQKNKREAHTGIAFLSSAGTVKLQHLFRYINPCSTLLPINSLILSCRGMESAAKSKMEQLQFESISGKRLLHKLFLLVIKQVSLKPKAVSRVLEDC